MTEFGTIFNASDVRYKNPASCEFHQVLVISKKYWKMVVKKGEKASV